MHARSRAPAWSARVAAHREGIPFVTTYHGVYSEHGAIKRFYNSVMASGDAVIANSAFTADTIRKRYGTPEDRLYTIPRGVDFEVFRRNSIDISRIENLHNRLRCHNCDLSSNTIFLLPARLTRWKGQVVAIEACKTLADRGISDFLLLIAGDDQGRSSYRDELTSLISQYGLGQRVLLTGDVEDIAAAYSISNFVVVPSIEPEAFGRTAVEAQAMGRPVIASNGGALSETVLDEVTGWHVQPGSSLALANAMMKALNIGVDRYKLMSEAAFFHAKDRYCISNMVSDTINVYAHLLT